MKNAGFNLLELVLVVLILGVVAAIAVPRMSRGAEGADVNAFAQNIGEMMSAIDRYKVENGAYPTQATGMRMPSAITSQFHGERGKKFSMLGGGTWKYMHTPGISPVICAVFDEAPSEDRMREIDAIIDDGDLTTGLFTKFNVTRYDLVIR